MKNEHLIKALIKKLEGEIAVAEANVSVYINNLRVSENILIL